MPPLARVAAITALVAAIDQYGTLLEIGLQRRCRVFGENVETAQHVADRPVAVAGFAFTAIDGFVDAEFPSGVTGKQIENAVVF